MGFIMENKTEFDTCPICGSRDVLVTELSDGTKVRTCRDIDCPMYYIPVRYISKLPEEEASNEEHTS